MSGDHSPYATPQVPMTPPLAPYQAAAPPAQIKVFGILHLVIGGLGLLMLPVTLLLQKFNESNFAAQEAAGGAQAMQGRISRELTKAMQELTWLSMAMSLVLGCLLLVAGIGLLKRKSSGLKVSNVYSWLSIAGKAAMLALTVVVVVPRMNAVMAEVAGQGADSNMVAIMKGAMLGSAVVTPILYCVYPVLSLILLNRQRVRESLA